MARKRCFSSQAVLDLCQRDRQACFTAWRETYRNHYDSCRGANPYRKQKKNGALDPGQQTSWEKEMPILEANGRKAWSIAALLFLFSVVNFIDKLVMGLAAVPIMKEFQLTPSQYGAVGSSFFFLYAISGLVVGLFIIQRASPKWLLIGLVLIWTIAQLPMMFGSSLLALYTGRVLLGLGEGPATPSAYHALYGWFTSERRNLPTSVLLAGVGAGFLIGSPVLTHIIATYGWRSGFLLCGVISILWMIVWGIFGADGPLIKRHANQAAETDRVPWRQFWQDSTVLGNVVLATCCYWVTGLSITWLAPYLQLGLGYSAKDTGWLVSIILGSQIFVQFGISWISHRMLLAGQPSRHSRGVVMGASVLLAGAAMVLATLADQPTIKVILLAAAFTMPQIAFVIGPAIVGEVAPPTQRGTALLVTYSIMTVSALISPVATGWVVQAAGAEPLVGYNHALWLTGAILAFGGLWGMATLDPEATRARFHRGAILSSEPTVARQLAI
jgi:MFS family permease